MKNERMSGTGLICLILFLTAPCQIWAVDNNDVQKESSGWKWDVTIYDKPGWYTPWMTPIKLIGDEIILQCISHPDEAYADDFYAEKSETVTLSSTDGGKSWHRTSAERYNRLTIVDDYGHPNAWYKTFSEQPDDRVKAYLDTKSSFSPELEQQRRDTLTAEGMADVIDKGWAGWTIFPESMAEKLKAMGYDVFYNHVAIPKGQAAVYSLTVYGKWSTDGGKTWNDSQIELPRLGRGPVYNGQLVLPDGTRLWFFYGTELNKSGGADYVLRSADQGKTWKTSVVPADPNWTLSETAPLVLPGGRVLLLMRCDAGDGVGYIHMSYSDDSGLTWQPAKRTQMRGAPIGTICLKSGAVLCTYGYRYFPGGIRACLSYDKGETWDIKHEKILRDDIIPGCWISPCGAQSVQLADGTIFTAYTLQKADKLKEGDTAGGNVYRVTGTGNGRFHCYLAGCRYTEDYVRPLPAQNSVPAAGRNIK